MVRRPCPWKIALLLEMFRGAQSGGIVLGKTAYFWCKALEESCESLDAMKRGEVDWDTFDATMERLKSEDDAMITEIRAQYPIESEVYY